MRPQYWYLQPLIFILPAIPWVVLLIVIASIINVIVIHVIGIVIYFIVINKMFDICLQWRIIL